MPHDLSEILQLVSDMDEIDSFISGLVTQANGHIAKARSQDESITEAQALKDWVCHKLAGLFWFLEKRSMNPEPPVPGENESLTLPARPARPRSDLSESVHGQRKLAKLLGISPAYVSKLRGLGVLVEREDEKGGYDADASMKALAAFRRGERPSKPKSVDPLKAASYHCDACGTDMRVPGGYAPDWSCPVCVHGHIKKVG